MEGSINIKTGINDRMGLDTDITKASKKTALKPKRGRPKKLTLGNPVDGPRIKKKTPHNYPKAELPKSPLNKQTVADKHQATPLLLKPNQDKKNEKSSLSSRQVDIRLVPVKSTNFIKENSKTYNLEDLQKIENNFHAVFLENANDFANSRLKLLTEGQDYRSEYESSEGNLRASYSSYIHAHVDTLNYQINSLNSQKNYTEEKKEDLQDRIEKTEELIKIIPPQEGASGLYANLEAYEARADKLHHKILTLKKSIENISSDTSSKLLMLMCASYKELENAIIDASIKNQPALAKINQILKTPDFNMAILGIDEATIERHLESKKIKVNEDALKRVKEASKITTRRRVIENINLNDIGKFSKMSAKHDLLPVTEYLSSFILENTAKLPSFEATFQEILDNLIQILKRIKLT